MPARRTPGFHHGCTTAPGGDPVCPGIEPGISSELAYAAIPARPDAGDANRVCARTTPVNRNTMNATATMSLFPPKFVPRPALEASIRSARQCSHLEHRTVWDCPTCGTLVHATATPEVDAQLADAECLACRRKRGDERPGDEGGAR